MAIANEGDRLSPARSIGALHWIGLGQPYDRIRRAGRFICKAILSDNARHLELNRSIASNACLLVRVVCLIAQQKTVRLRAVHEAFATRPWDYRGHRLRRKSR